MCLPCRGLLSVTKKSHWKKVYLISILDMVYTCPPKCSCKSNYLLHDIASFGLKVATRMRKTEENLIYNLLHNGETNMIIKFIL